MPSRTSLSLNLSRIQSPSVRGRLVKVLRLKRFEIPEFADKVDRLDVLKVDRHHIARGVQKLQFAFADEIRRGNVSVDRIPVHLPDHDFFMG